MNTNSKLLMICLIAMFCMGLQLGRFWEYAEMKSSIEILQKEYETVVWENNRLSAQVSRAEGIQQFSTIYDIPANKAALIWDVAEIQGLDKRTAFGLVWVESNFNPRAVSRVGARGYTQVMPGTWTDERCFGDPFSEVANLFCGFGYLKKLMERYGDEHKALLVYNGCLSDHCQNYPVLVLTSTETLAGGL